MERMKSATRLFVEERLARGQVIGLDASRSHFLRSVLRLSKGAHLAPFNGEDGEWLARLDGLGKGWASLQCLEQRRSQEPEPDVWLAFAPIKRARIDFVVEKATELGCSRLLPVLTRYTIVDRVNLQRLSATAREAAEQCQRLSVPVICKPLKLESLLDQWSADRLLVFADETAAGQSPLAALRVRNAAHHAVLIGPEGGFAAPERAMLQRRSWVQTISLGPRILRADTAAVAALSLLQATVGDWSERDSLPNDDPVGE